MDDELNRLPELPPLRGQPDPLPPAARDTAWWNQPITVPTVQPRDE